MVHAPNGTRAKWHTRQMVHAPNGTGAKWHTPPIIIGKLRGLKLNLHRITMIFLTLFAKTEVVFPCQDLVVL
jgi:hypothetical protein